VCREHLSTNTAPVISSKHELANPTSSHDHVSVEVDIWSITAVNAVRREHLSTNTAPIISSKHELENVRRDQKGDVRREKKADVSRQKKGDKEKTNTESE
jgi:hypothetical protein